MFLINPAIYDKLIEASGIKVGTMSVLWWRELSIDKAEKALKL